MTSTDIRDPAAVRAVLHAHQPEVVFHLAAQALVRRSYADPVETWGRDSFPASDPPSNW